MLEYINPQPNKIYIDATFGGGGHTKKILNAEPNCQVISIDWDKNAIKQNGPPLEEQYGNRLKVLWGNFTNIPKLIKNENIETVDGIIADFGTSQFQIKEMDGFSFQKDSLLDMRMSSSHQRIKASTILNYYNEPRLAKIIFEYGEESKAKKIAREIVEFRKKKKFSSTQQLVEIFNKITPRREYHKKIHPATKTFQALRIEVNKELENIEKLLISSIKIINKGGRIVCISFHSLEDRIVKHFFKQNKETLNILTTKPILASKEEVDGNRSSRSSKLRAAEKI